MSVTILNHDLLMSENLERMDTVHSNGKHFIKKEKILGKISKKKIENKVAGSQKVKKNKKQNEKKSHQLHKHMFATVPISLYT